MNAIETEDLTREYDGVTALNRLTLSIKQGTIFGFLGPNGAGKTTALNLLIGLIPPTFGRARVLGFDSTRQAQSVRERIGVLLEDHGLYEYLTANDNLEFFGRVNRLAQPGCGRRIQSLMEKVGLWEKRDQQVKEWSKGMKQKLAICRALLHKPQILFLDEPTSGLDPTSQRMVREEILKLKASENVTIFLNTHNLNEAERVCDEIAIIKKGVLITRGQPEEIKARATEEGRITARIDELPEGVEAELRALPFVKDLEVNAHKLRILTDDPSRSAELNLFLVSRGVAVAELHRQQVSLEEIFLQLTEEEGKDDA